MTVTGIDLSAIEFWGLPLPERSAAFAVLRAQGRPQFFTEPEAPFAVNPRGYYALVRHADVIEASRTPAPSAAGRAPPASPTCPPAFNEYFGSMINMDDPRHARLRRIVSRAFTPRMIAKFEEDVRAAAVARSTTCWRPGPGDFVPQVAARLPLKIICDMMGIAGRAVRHGAGGRNIILPEPTPSSSARTRTRRSAQLLGAAPRAEPAW